MFAEWALLADKGVTRAKGKTKRLNAQYVTINIFRRLFSRKRTAEGDTDINKPISQGILNIILS